MTKAELIEAMKDMPDDEHVYIDGGPSACLAVNSVYYLDVADIIIEPDDE